MGKDGGVKWVRMQDMADSNLILILILALIEPIGPSPDS